VAAPAEWPVNKSVDLSSYLARDVASGPMSDLEAFKNPAWHRFCCPYTLSAYNGLTSRYDNTQVCLLDHEDDF
jgi:hypothetical protein